MQLLASLAALATAALAAVKQPCLAGPPKGCTLSNRGYIPLPDHEGVDCNPCRRLFNAPK